MACKTVAELWKKVRPHAPTFLFHLQFLIAPPVSQEFKEKRRRRTAQHQSYCCGGADDHR